MSSIGAISVDILRGETEGESGALKEHVTTWTVPGIAGTGALKLGKNRSSFRYLAIKFGSESAVETFLRNVEAAVGTVVSITDDFGQVRANMLVEEARAPRKIVATSNLGTHRGEIRITGKVTI